MKKFFEENQELTLGAVGVIILMSLIFYYIRGTAFLSRAINDALAPPPPGSTEIFYDLEGARVLGIVPPEEDAEPSDTPEEQLAPPEE